MLETESDHHRGVAAVARLDLEAPPAAPASSSCATTTATARDEDEEDGFTFAAVAIAAAVSRLQDADCAFPDARMGGGPVYPVFGRPRWWSLREQQHRQEEEEGDPAGTGTATVRRRVPLGRLFQEDRWSDCAPSASGQQPADDAAEAELEGVPAETYCLWSPGASPPAGSRRASSPARCWKSGSIGSPVLRWRRQRRVVRGGGKSTTLLPCKQDLVRLVASAATFRRSYLPF